MCTLFNIIVSENVNHREVGKVSLAYSILAIDTNMYLEVETVTSYGIKTKSVILQLL